MITDLRGHANLWYLDIVRTLLEDGDPVVARGRAIHEAQHVVLRMDDPRKRVLTVPYRRINPFFAIADPLWILAGRSDAKWITRYNSQLSQFLDKDAHNPDHFHGAYGERLRRHGQVTQMLDQLTTSGLPPVDQLQDIIDQLKADPGSRRAVAVLHNPDVDRPSIDTKDRPCNIATSVQLRNGKLHMALFNRSNDITLGLSATNIPQFTTLLEVLACAVGADVGTYTSLSSSLHVYDDDGIARRCLARAPRKPFDLYDYVNPTPMQQSWSTSDQDRTGEGWPLSLDRFTAIAEVMEKSPGGAGKTPPLACPYWRSVCRMLKGWRALKGFEETDAKQGLRLCLEELEGMEAEDWHVAALEFLHRWSNRRGGRSDLPRMVKNNAFDHFGSGAVSDYIMHDDGAEIV